jgi:DNA uptake protein ComE-like DNA-binding protein
MWTLRQRKAVLLLCVGLGIYLAVEVWRKPAVVTDPPNLDAPRAAEIEDRIDPNTADTEALAAIPNLGEKRAAQIVAYREEFHQKHPNEPAFKSVDDLMQLKGFGAATAANAAPYLRFAAKNAD